MPRPRRILLLLGLAAVACGAAALPSRVPEPALVSPELRYEGSWFGEVGGRAGTLTIEPLGPGRLRGLFRSNDGAVVRVLLLTYEPRAPGVPSVIPFTWQDGRGGRGWGWLRLNPESNALDGDHGYGRATEGAGEWVFVRVDAPQPGPPRGVARAGAGHSSGPG